MRIGAVPYLNGKPLIHGLDVQEDVELVFEVPSTLALMLRDGVISAGLVSVAACFVNPALEIIPGISISCIGPARSVKLFYTGDIQSIKRVALDISSLTSVLLAKVILQERYNLQPEFVDMSPALPEMLKDCNAAVMIGDNTMQVSANWDGESMDMGEEWNVLTGLPFVFAVWAVNTSIADPKLIDILHQAKASGLQNINGISRIESDRLGLPVEVCRQYLSKVMSYDLTELHLKGLHLFMEKAREHGFIQTISNLKMFQRQECS